MKWFEENETAINIWGRKYLGDYKTTMTFMVDEVFKTIPQIGEIEKALELPDIPGRMKNILLSGLGLPGGRIIYYFSCLARGEARKLTPMNCFVIPIEDDSIRAIFKYKSDMAMTFKAGGGVGTTISGLRPKGAAVNNSAVSSTGPVSFLKSIDADAEVVGQNARRGALMKAMSVYHPDIFEFISLKHDGGYTCMNTSVMIDDWFMAQESHSKIDLWFPEKISETPSTFTEVPYIANCYYHSQYEFFKVQGEEGFRQKKTYRSTTKKELWDAIAYSAHKCGDPGILFWDNITRDWTGDEELHSTNPCGEEPLPAYGACNLGALNFSRYTDEKEFTKDCQAFTVFLDSLITYCIKNQSYPLPEQAQSAAKFRQIGLGITGLADYFIINNAVYGDDKSKSLLENRMVLKRQAEIQASQTLNEVIEGKSGPRNTQLSTVAPTGSTSMILGCSGGIEPNFAFEQQKLVGGEYIDVKIPIAYQGQKKYLIEAHQIHWKGRIEIQKIAQKYTDGSISSTINLPNGVKAEEIQDIYQEAWNAGLKGITVYRDGSKGFGAIRKKETKKERGILNGKTVKVPLDTSWYITVNFDEEIPREVFINAGKSGSDTKAWTEAIGRLSSLYLQTGGRAEKLISALQDIKGQKTIFKNGWSIQSGPDAIAQAIGSILTVHTFLECPNCERMTFKFSEGCGSCESCGFEKC